MGRGATWTAFGTCCAAQRRKHASTWNLRRSRTWAASPAPVPVPGAELRVSPFGGPLHR